MDQLSLNEDEEKTCLDGTLGMDLHVDPIQPFSFFTCTLPAIPEHSSIPVHELLELNRKYQETLKLCIKQTKAAKQRNRELKKKIASTNQRIRKATKKKNTGPSCFSDSSDSTPQWNSDARAKLDLESKIPIHSKHRKWTKQERQGLFEGIIQHKKKQAYDLCLSQCAPHYKSPLQAAKFATESVNGQTDEEYSRDLSIPVNWVGISKQFVPTRSDTDCRIQWENNDYPGINKATWNKTEDKNLLALVKLHKTKDGDWIEIANELGTNRTPFQCLKRYQRSLNTAIVKGKWTLEEDDKLRSAVKRHGTKNWQQVANDLIGRTGQQCLHRWQKTLHPDIKRGRWSEDEDKALTLAVKAYGNKSWVKVQQHVEGRTDVQCRERWVNILNPNLNVGAWTDEEDAKLNEAVVRLGLGKWSQVAALVPPRTDNQCWRRWKAMHSKELDGYRETILKKRKGMVNNFVGREKERPQLTPEDIDDQVGPGSSTDLPSEEFGEQDFHPPSPVSQSSGGTISLSYDQKEYPTIYNPNHLPDQLPLFLPQQETQSALSRLVRCLRESPSSREDVLTQEQETALFSCPHFAVLGGIFNGLFLFPAALHAQAHFDKQDDEELNGRILPES